MGSGKTTVGRIVAERLGWTFVDFDAEIEARTGRTVTEIFADEGEAAFRALESEVGRDLLSRTEVVLASGGGWPASEGRLDGLPAGSCSVWLRVDPGTAVGRCAMDGGSRPLLAGPDPTTRASELLAEREPFYARARVHLETEGASPDEVAGAIVDIVDGPTVPLQP